MQFPDGPVIDAQRALVSQMWEHYLSQCCIGTYRDLVRSLVPVALTHQKGLTLAVVEEGWEVWEWKWFPSLVIRLAAWLLRSFAVRVNTPQFNDYLMAKWELTRDRELVVEMLHRMHCGGLKPEVKATCEWMVKSVAEQNDAFATDLKIAQMLVEPVCE